MANIKKILFAEDEPDIQTIAQMAMEMMGGYEVKLCQDGQEAIQTAQRFHPDLLLLDVMMPSVDGLTALKEIRKLHGCEHTPVIFMTAKVQADDMVKYEKLGAIGVIPKPFDPMTLTDQIEAICARTPQLQSHQRSLF